MLDRGILWQDYGRRTGVVESLKSFGTVCSGSCLLLLPIAKKCENPSKKNPSLPVTYCSENVSK